MELLDMSDMEQFILFAGVVLVMIFVLHAAKKIREDKNPTGILFGGSSSVCVDTCTLCCEPLSEKEASKRWLTKDIDKGVRPTYQLVHPDCLDKVNRFEMKEARKK